jgi:hypothetical protein
MKTAAPAALFAEGVAAAQAGETGIIVLDFGQPQQRGSTFGALLLDNQTFASTADIETAVEQFLYGYYLYSTAQMQLVVAVGTNNFAGQEGVVTFAHGAAWASLASGVEDYVLDQNWYGLSAAAADDIEPNWSTPAQARDWANGFDSVDSTRLYDTGSADGCPTDSPTDGAPVDNPCNNGWHQSDERYVAWGAAPAYPLTAIYEDGSLAREWERISLESALTTGQAMLFQGALTQHAACPQDTSCQPGRDDNTPSVGWSQLLYALNSDPLTSVPNLPWATVLTWEN